MKNIVKGVILSFVSFSIFVVFSDPVHGSEANGKGRILFSDFYGICRKACSDLILKQGGS